jgi:hypothetical protein
LRGLLEAARSGHGNDEALKIAATGVLGQFAGREYDLDMFCRSPHHSNGNVLRGAIRRIVTGAVTPESREEILLTLAPLR